MSETVLYSVDNHVATVTLNRPSHLNALNPELLETLSLTLRRAKADEDVRVVVITGAGRGFCSGADLSIENMPANEQLPNLGAMVQHQMEQVWNPLVTTIANLGKPTIAAVNGLAVGAGVGIALACDMVVAAETASFAIVFGPKLAIIPDAGCTWLLARLLGPVRARGLAYLGDPLPARTAAEWGMIWQAVPDAELSSTTKDLATRLAKLDPLAANRIRYALDQAMDNDLDSQLALEARTQAELTNRAPFLEGMMRVAKQPLPAS